jgi:hypothetical protein
LTIFSRGRRPCTASPPSPLCVPCPPPKRNGLHKFPRCQNSLDPNRLCCELLLYTGFQWKEPREENSAAQRGHVLARRTRPVDEDVRSPSGFCNGSCCRVWMYLFKYLLIAKPGTTQPSSARCSELPSLNVPTRVKRNPQ